MIKVESLQKSYGSLKVLKGIDLEIADSTVVTIVGASGAGKSTLLHLIGTLDRPDEGRVLIDDTDLYKLSDKQLADFRNRNIGFVFQFHHLLPEFTAVENVALPAMIAGLSKDAALKQASELLDYLKLSDRLTHKPSQLSGGEQQRVAVARALVNNPKLILADEPTGNLDSKNGKEVMELLTDLHKEGTTIVMVTHSQRDAGYADRIINLFDGKIVEDVLQEL